MKQATLIAAYDDTLNVHVGDRRIGQITPSYHGWAAYEATLNDRIVERRIATCKTIHAAVEAVLLAEARRVN